MTLTKQERQRQAIEELQRNGVSIDVNEQPSDSEQLLLNLQTDYELPNYLNGQKKDGAA
jgi:hypothetical protein